MKRQCLILVLFLLVSVGAARAGDQPRVLTTEGSFDDVKQFVQDAIIGQGLVIDYNGRIGEMLERTRADVGGEKIYKNAEFLLFCSAVISRATMEADPTNISFCPYVIFVYELDTEPGKIHVGYRVPKIAGSEASKKSIAAVDKLLHTIIKEATE